MSQSSLPIGAAGYRVAEVDELGPAAAAAVGGFIAQHWKRRVALSIPRFFDWQFRDPPADFGRNRCVVALDAADRIRAFMGVTRRDLCLAGRRVRAVELTTWVVDEELRGRGVGRAILRHIQASHEAVVGMGISDSALSLYLRAGFRYLRHLPRYVKIFNPDAVEPISEITAVGRKVIRQGTSVAPPAQRSEPISFSEAARSAEPLHAHCHCLVRDAAQLDWRYARHPCYRYQAFRVGQGPRAACVILRVDEKPSLRIVHVVDVLGEESSIPAVVAFLEAFCRERGVDLADFTCSLDRIGHVFWHCGWLSAVDDFYIQVPNWFYPIEMRHPPTTSLILWARDDMLSLSDRSRLYVTKGDCDADRPTLEYLEEHGIAL